MFPKKAEDKAGSFLKLLFLSSFSPHEPFEHPPTYRFTLSREYFQ